MKTAYFIESMNVVQVPLVNRRDTEHHYYTYDYDRLVPVGDGNAISVNSSVKEHVVDIHKIIGVFDDKRPLYVAYSEEVDKLLYQPIKAIRNSAEAEVASAKDETKIVRKRLNKEFSAHAETVMSIKSASFWQRLKYAFTGNTKHIGV